MTEAGALQPAGDHPGESTPVTILLVDDEKQVRAILAEGLSLFGYIVLEAADGDEALRLAGARLDLRLVVSDIRMPGMTGVELAGRMAALRRELKIVLMSGYHHEDPADRVVLRKPFSIGQLDAAIRRELTLQ